MSTVLVIDDNPSVRDVLAFALRDSGHEVMVAEDGRKGLLLARTAAIDAAIVDVHMPGLSGIEVCETLQALARERNRQLPTWLITGAHSEELAARGMAAGAVAVLRKPFGVAELCREVGQHVADPPAGATGPANP